MAIQGLLVDKSFSASITPGKKIKEISIHTTFEGFVRRVNLGITHQGVFVDKRFSANIAPAKKLKKLTSTQPFKGLFVAWILAWRIRERSSTKDFPQASHLQKNKEISIIRNLWRVYSSRESWRDASETARRQKIFRKHRTCKKI